MLSRYDILKLISEMSPATLQALFDEISDKDKDGYSLIEELDYLLSQGLIEEYEEKGSIAYKLTEAGRKELKVLGGIDS
ncbi:MAG: hypothetical protein KatS3mg078_1891 [Deltaproteobacteria bacterium]|jgi:DNA-binding PadR family transcriptional regulator|nr:MAG: hypothetical protein KatS3mg078_1891 [Deltaproteobacteria bacterium]